MNETTLAERFASHLDCRYPELVGVIAALAAPVIAFFAVPVLLGLMSMLMLDFVTGVVKAQHLKKVSSARFGIIFERCVLYALMYFVLHMLTLATPAPWDFFTKLFEGFVMTGLLFKESLSVLENIKATLQARGRSIPILDLVITKLGLDLDHIMKDFEKLKPPAASELQAPADPFAANPFTQPFGVPGVPPQGAVIGEGPQHFAQLNVPGATPIYQALPQQLPPAPPAGPDAPQGD